MWARSDKAMWEVTSGQISGQTVKRNDRQTEQGQLTRSSPRSNHHWNMVFPQSEAGLGQGQGGLTPSLKKNHHSTTKALPSYPARSLRTLSAPLSPRTRLLEPRGHHERGAHPRAAAVRLRRPGDVRLRRRLRAHRAEDADLRLRRTVQLRRAQLHSRR